MIRIPYVLQPRQASVVGTNMLLLLSCIFSVLILSGAADTIPANQPLADGKTVISSGGKFELGFFSPQTSDRKRYLGIWFHKVTMQTVVWVANIDSPLNDTNGMLNFTRQGIFTLLNGSGRVIWSSNASRSVQIPIAQLLDSGNLVVRDATENYVWQSFDYPTDTALPGMKLGIDLKTGFRRSLWSWKSTNDPSKGQFSWIFDPRGFPQPFIMNGSIERYRSGPWNGQPWNGRAFAIGSSQLPSLDYNYTYVSNPADNCDIYGQCHAYGLCNSGNSPIYDSNPKPAAKRLLFFKSFSHLQDPPVMLQPSALYTCHPVAANHFERKHVPHESRADQQPFWDSHVTVEMLYEFHLVTACPVDLACM